LPERAFFLGYVSNKGHTLVDERLYLSKEWIADKRRRRECHIPARNKFKTTHDLALEILREHRTDFASPVGCGPMMSLDTRRIPLRMDHMGERYILDVPETTRIRDLASPLPRRQKGRGRQPKNAFRHRYPVERKSFRESMEAIPLESRYKRTVGGVGLSHPSQTKNIVERGMVGRDSNRVEDAGNPLSPQQCGRLRVASKRWFKPPRLVLD